MTMVPANQSKVDVEALGRCEVKDIEGRPRSLSSLWKERPAILIFLRHFACIACRAHAQQIWKERAKFEAGGAKIHFIGNGSSSFIHRFKVSLGIQDASVFTDTSLASFEAAGFERGFLKALGPKSLVNGVKMMTQGHKQTEITDETGDVWQLGGVIVIRPNGSIAYHYVSEALGDFPPEKDLEGLANDPAEIVD